MNSRTSLSPGFTLIEILIAIVIFAIVISTLFSSFNAFIISSENVKEVIAHSEKIKTIFKLISQDLESLYVLQPPRYQKPEFNSEPDPYRFTGKEITLGQQTVSTMVFTSFSHAKFGQDQRSGIARIAYYMRENENDGYDLYRADVLQPFPEVIESCSDPVLLSDIAGFQATFKDVDGEEYKYWDSEDEALKYAFPASIDFRFTFGSGEKQQVLVMSINLAAGRKPIE